MLLEGHFVSRKQGCRNLGGAPGQLNLVPAAPNIFSIIIAVPSSHLHFYRGADKSLARPTSPCILFDVENISFFLFVNCHWVIAPWQWLYYMYTNMEREEKKNVTGKFKSGGLHEKHVVATWKLGNHLSIRL